MSARIVGIGAAVCDTLIAVDSYPREDTKMRADEIRHAGGGPVATGLVAASKLGESAAYIGALADDEGGRFLRADNDRYGVSNEYVVTAAGALSFTSYVLLSKEHAGRTCVFHRGSVAFDTLNEAQKQAVRAADVLMVDGNYLDAAVEGAKIAKESGTLVLYDAGGRYDGIERLLPLADVLIPSEEFALGVTGKASAEEAAKALFEAYAPRVVVITQGARGGLWTDGKAGGRYGILDVQVLDSNGSGDVFHGAYAAALCKGYPTEKACVYASAVSSLKCMGMGSRASAPDHLTVLKTLKEFGYHEFEKDLEQSLRNE